LDKKPHDPHRDAHEPGQPPKKSGPYEISWPAILPVRIESSADAPQKYAREQVYQRKQLGLACWLNAITASTAVIGLSGLLFIWAQLNVIRGQLTEMHVATTAATRSADIASDAMRVGQRAYLVFHHATLDGPPTANKKLVAAIQMRNSGQTPAVDVSYSIGLQVLDSYPTDIKYGKLIPASPIGSGQELVLKAWLLPNLTAKDMGEITAQSFAFGNNKLTITTHPQLYLYGIVHYKDVFGGDGTSEFCDVYVYLGDSEVLAGCPTHNDLQYTTTKENGGQSPN
jgi:hypothetical protein